MKRRKKRRDQVFLLTPKQTRHMEVELNRSSILTKVALAGTSPSNAVHGHGILVISQSTQMSLKFNNVQLDILHDQQQQQIPSFSSYAISWPNPAQKRFQPSLRSHTQRPFVANYIQFTKPKPIPSHSWGYNRKDRSEPKAPYACKTINPKTPNHAAPERPAKGAS